MGNIIEIMRKLPRIKVALTDMKTMKTKGITIYGISQSELLKKVKELKKEIEGKYEG